VNISAQCIAASIRVGERPVQRLCLWAIPLLGACATYQARPLDTTDPVRRFAARRLDDPALLAGLDSLGALPDSGAWRDWQLGAAAWLLRPERGRALAQIRVAEAARISAGARPPVSVGSETEYSFSGSGSEPRVGLAISALFVLEPGGKRGARINRASARVMAEVARGQEESWLVRWRVRQALLRWNLARRSWRAGSAELNQLDSVVALTRARFDQGVLNRSELARVEADRQAWAAEVAARQRELDGREIAVSVAVGVPASAMTGFNLVQDTLSHCAAGPAQDSLVRVALEHRPELHRVLAEYQVAEAEVRLEVADSRPDLSLGPGLFFDHGISKWTIAFGLPSLVLNRRRGPVLEAEARREVAAREITEVQELVLGEVRQAVGECAAAAGEVAALNVSAAERGLMLAEEAYQRGELGRLEVEIARLELVRARRRIAEADSRKLAAGLDLERVLGVWDGLPESSRLGKGGL
jgi:outer membrane protein, heavy metal efflux system